MYTLEQLKIFVTVCECGSFSAAARKLKRAQSGVSQAVANLEIEIDQQLFHRDKNKPELTVSGRALLPVVRAILHQQHYFEQKIESIASDHEQELVIAVDESLVDDSLIALFADLAAHFPNTDFDLVSASTFEVDEMVRQGRAQIGIHYVGGDLKDAVDFFLLGQAKFVNISAPQHPLAQFAQVTDSDLKRYRQCVHRDAQHHELWFTYAISNAKWYANSHENVVALVVQNVGWANVPERHAKKLLSQKKLVRLPVVHERDGWLTHVGCSISRRCVNGPVLRHLLAQLQQYRFEHDHWQKQSHKK
ncbi:HTH-type transcriptional regulator ArgP [Vibrio stylophorae]|uniref:HTH-type transcriptional regulator ArgP n=1 Tax=Vibrio stylophorae TaxID=659351 RepID=A0ABM8ZS57_9VIBR|nr:LysR family transcriptional regulator [Vibrio stylophorae]CAH0533146.1 HTH-type transcriptional regulator ArgP [Vibrio stylophorae]